MGPAARAKNREIFKRHHDLMLNSELLDLIAHNNVI